MVDKATVIKIITAIIAIVLFGYSANEQDEITGVLLRQWGGIDLMSNIFFGGFAIIYFGYLLSIILKHDVDKEMNTFWAFFGFGLHVGLGFLYIEIGRKSNKYRNSNDSDWMIIGIISLIQAVLLFLDGWLASGADLC